MDLTQYFKALADETRLRLLNLIPRTASLFPSMPIKPERFFISLDWPRKRPIFIGFLKGFKPGPVRRCILPPRWA